MADASSVDIFDKSRWSEDERRYFEIIDQACKDRENEILSNGKPGHAAYIVHKFLDSGKNHIRLFSGTLARTFMGVSVYDNPHIIEAAINFLRREGTTLSILLEKEIDVLPNEEVGDHPLVHAYAKAKKNDPSLGKLIIHQANTKIVQWLREKNYARNWMVMDEQAYRLESDADHATAFVNFGDPDTAQLLARTFDFVAERSDQLYSH